MNVERAGKQLRFAESVCLDRLQRNVNTVFVETPRHILPEIRQLQRRTGKVRQSLTLAIAVPAKIQYEPANRVCGIFAVCDDIVPGRVPQDGLILPEGDQQVGK